MSSWLEYLSVAFNVAYIVLAARKSIWCWPMGILGSALGSWLFIEVKLYAEALLFAYYIVMGIYGWWSWGRAPVRDVLDVRSASLSFHVKLCAAGYILSGCMYAVLVKFTDAQMPMLDAFTTAFSFLATWMVARKILENWIYWIAIDALTVYLYIARNLELYALLSLLYTGMAVYGYLQWRPKTQASFA